MQLILKCLQFLLRQMALNEQRKVVKGESKELLHPSPQACHIAKDERQCLTAARWPAASAGAPAAERKLNRRLLALPHYV